MEAAAVAACYSKAWVKKFSMVDVYCLPLGKVRKAHIIDGSLHHALLLEIFTDKGIGTEIIKLGRRTKATEGL